MNQRIVYYILLLYFFYAHAGRSSASLVNLLDLRRPGNQLGQSVTERKSSLQRSNLITRTPTQQSTSSTSLHRLHHSLGTFPYRGFVRQSPCLRFAPTFTPPTPSGTIINHHALPSVSCLCIQSDRHRIYYLNSVKKTDRRQEGHVPIGTPTNVRRNLDSRYFSRPHFF